MTPYLKLDHVDKVFTRGKVSSEVLKDINLNLGKGEYTSPSSAIPAAASRRCSTSSPA
jgi:hypothetical protein